MPAAPRALHPLWGCDAHLEHLPLTGHTTHQPMPELPDVETYRRYINATCLHQKIAGIQVNDTRVLKNTSRPKLEATLKGQSFAQTRRHGKYLLVELDDGHWLILHFGMTGRLSYYKNGQSPEYTQARFDFENGYHLAYVMPRKLGQIRLVKDAGAFIQAKQLGPDVLSDDFDFDAFREALAGRRGMIKSTLMNQEIMAGIGNEYSDEILFQAGIHPKTRVDELDEKTLRRIFKTMQDVLQTAVEHQANWDELPDSWLLRHREEGADCPRGDGQVTRIEVSGRAGYYCPACQPRQ